MNQMTVTLEWDEELGPRWLYKDQLMSMLNLSGSQGETLRVRDCTYPDSTPKERAQEEFQQLCIRMNALGALSYKDLMSFPEDTRALLENQYKAMDQYRKAILARIDAWTDETS